MYREPYPGAIYSTTTQQKLEPAKPEPQKLSFVRNWGFSVSQAAGWVSVGKLLSTTFRL